MKRFYTLDRPLQIAVYLTVLFSILFAIFTLANKVWDDVNELKTAKSDNMQWTLSQLEVDYLNLKVEQKNVISGGEVSLKELREKFDVFYSRVAIFRQGPLVNLLASDPKADRILDEIWVFLQQSIPLIDGDDQTLLAEIAALSKHTDSLDDDIRSLALSGINLSALASDREREDVSQTLIMIALLKVALLVALLVLSWIFFRQYRRMMAHASDTQIASSRLNAVVTSALDAVIVIDHSAKILEFNGAAEQIFGYSKEQAVGGDLAEMIVPAKYRLAHREGMKRYLETGEKRVVGKGRLQLEARRKSGEIFPVELSISSAESQGGEVFVAFLRDISDRVADEEELKQARDDALAGEKAKAELLAVMSHEMRTPLNGMLGILELMHDTHLSARQVQYLDIIDTSGKMLLHHVSDVLDISRLDSGKFETDKKKFEITRLMTEVCDGQRPSASAKGNRLTTKFVDLKDQIVLGDDIRLRQVLLNIIGNAIKFTQDGHISVQAERRDDDIEIRISDTGIGIHGSDLTRIFEDFVTLDSSYGRTEAGTGLGLGITKRMIQAMGGTMGVESVQDEGSLFWVRLPLPEQKDGELETNSVEISEPLPITPQQILVVEDNQINRFVVREMLEKDGHSVFEANDGEEGVAFCGRQKFDTILMDISMPRLDGVEATKIIRESGGPSANSPIIALTAHALPDEIFKFNEAGMNDTLIKPISRVLLRKAIRMASDIDDERFERSQDAKTDSIIDHNVLDELWDTLGEKAAADLIRQFVDETEIELDWITSDQRTKFDTEFVNRVHKLAGSASLFGAVRLRELLFQIETLCKTERLEGLSELIRELEQAWQTTKRHLL